MPGLFSPDEPGDEKKLILFVCTGNICRSAFAEAALKQRLPEDSEIEVTSAGTLAVVGRGMDETMSTAGISRGLQDTSHTARQLTGRTLQEATLICVFSTEHLSWIADERPDLLSRTVAVGQLKSALETYDPGRLFDLAEVAPAVWEARPELQDEDWIADPYRRGLDAAVEAVDSIVAALDVLVSRLATSERRIAS